MTHRRLTGIAKKAIALPIALVFALSSFGSPEPVRAVSPDIVVGPAGCGDAGYITDGVADNVQIEAALVAAGDGDIIELCAARYEYAEDVDYTDASIGITIQGVDAATTILDGNQEWNLLAIHASDVDLTVSNLTFSNGNAGYGSAILLFDNGHRSSLTIEDSVFSSNNNEGAGAVHVEQGSAYVYDSTFSFNTGSRGAAVNVHKGMAFIESSQFYANTATGKAGAITATGKHSIVQVGLSYFEDNFAEEQGGAINVKDATLGIYFSTFVGNETNGSGGAIAQQGYDAVASNIYGSTFISNEAAVDGGAVWLRDADHRYDVRDSNFRNNHADGRGGGIYIDDQGRRATERDIAVVTNKFVGNTADLGGGMYYSLNDTGKSSTGAVPSIVLGNTFQRNSAQSGGGLAFATNYDGVTFGRVLRELNRKLVSNSFAGNRTRDKFSAKIYVLN